MSEQESRALRCQEAMERADKARLAEQHALMEVIVLMTGQVPEIQVERLPEGLRFTATAADEEGQASTGAYALRLLIEELKGKRGRVQ